MKKLCSWLLLGIIHFNLFSQISTVEEQFIKKSNRCTQYQEEQIPVIEVTNAIELGKLTALRFIEWVIENPTGVIALPTGKTPEYFIKFLQFYKKNWDSNKVQQELQAHGISSNIFPDTSNLKFVQLDEFYPIKPDRKNSFIYYLKTYYFPLLNLKPENILTFDKFINLPPEELCEHYDEQIKQWGGIGFFLGGIGPDGHIAFNMRGTPQNSKTRLVVLNYETAAVAAGSLGGMEFSRDKTAITTGLKTIMANPNATIIIIAAGEGKGPIVAQSIQEKPSRKCPASFLQNHLGSRFYITKGTAQYLSARQIEDLQKSNTAANSSLIDNTIIEIALNLHKKITSLNQNDLNNYPKGKILLKKINNLPALLLTIENNLINNIEKGLQKITTKRIMHTEPHHDDIMLSYHPVAINLLKQNENYFVSMTSGFNAVTNEFMLDNLRELSYGTLQYFAQDIFETSYKSILKRFAYAYEQKDQYLLHELALIIFARKCVLCFDIKTIDDLNRYLRDLEIHYKKTWGDSAAESQDLCKLKGMMRETEVEYLWALHNIPLDRIFHMRSKFYTNDYFGKPPSRQNDAQPFLNLLNNINPDLITVTVDPQATGPDTHYKVLQVIAESLRIKTDLNPNLKIWGYRNVWYQFTNAETNLMIPVSQEQLNNLHEEFCNCFLTQKEAPFPTYELDGPFSLLSIKIQEQQLQNLRTLLGNDFFDNHTDERLRNAKGMLFLQEMTVNEFLKQAESLEALTEL